MKTLDAHGTFDQAIEKSNDDVRPIAETLRSMIEEVYPEVVEVPWPSQGVIGYGVRPKKMSEHFCYIGAYKAHINLGFYYGTDLIDPEHLLEGTGKKFRHIKIRSLENVDLESLKVLLRQAVDERQSALGLE